MGFQAALRGTFILFVLKPAFRLFFRQSIDGLSGLPEGRPLVLAANHDSHLDALAVLAALPLRTAMRVRPAAAEDYFGGEGLGKRLLRSLLGIKLLRRGGLRRDRPDVAELAAVLAQGGSVLLFPEGTRGEPGRLGSFKSGAARLAGGVPGAVLVPVGILGTGACLGKGARFPMPGRVRVRFGPALSPQEGPKQTTRRLENAVKTLLRSAKPLRVAVVGIDGSGKSSCFRGLAAVFGKSGSVCGVGDSVFMVREGKNEDLEWLPGAARKAYFHFKAKGAWNAPLYELWKALELLSRLGLCRSIAGLSQAAHVFLDGDPVLNMAAWTLGRPGWRGARTVLWAASVLRVPLPDLVIHLRVGPANAMARIDKRGEALQAHENQDRLYRLQRGYDRILGLMRGRSGLRVSVLNTDGSTQERVLQEAVGAVVRGTEEACYGRGKSGKARYHCHDDLWVRGGLGEDPPAQAPVRA